MALPYLFIFFQIGMRNAILILAKLQSMKIKKNCIDIVYIIGRNASSVCKLSDFSMIRKSATIFQLADNFLL